MDRSVDELPFQPILNPCGKFVVIIDCAFPLFKQRFVHFAFCGGNQFELLISALLAVLAGIVMRNVAVQVLSDPKSKTAIDLLAFVTL